MVNLARQFLLYQRQLKLDLLPIEMALRWLIKLPPVNLHSVPATLLLCWKFTTRNINIEDTYVLGKGAAFAREEWRIFKAMGFNVSNVKSCLLAEKHSVHQSTARHQKLVLFNVLYLFAADSSVTTRNKLATCAGEMVALARRGP